MLQKISNLKGDEFEKFVVCPKRTKLYHLDECLERKHGTVLPKKCTNILSPIGKAKHCGNKLVDKVILKNGVTKFYPVKNLLLEEHYKSIREHFGKSRNDRTL